MSTHWCGHLKSHEPYESRFSDDEIHGKEIDRVDLYLEYSVIVNENGDRICAKVADRNIVKGVIIQVADGDAGGAV